MIGEQIKKLRLAAGISQVDLAKKLNVSKQSISNWENNNIMPSIDMLKRLCEYFSCSADYMLEMDDGKHLYIESTNLTVEQKLHIQQLVRDFELLNQKTME
jgi:transcriptional regulator with XRE-family HTH domain